MPKRLLICSPKGGCGKTNTSRNLAVAAALDGLKVVTVDFDQQRTLSLWWARRKRPLVEIVNYEATLTDVDDVLALDEGDLLILDSPPNHEGVEGGLQKLVAASDFILVPTRPTNDDAQSAIPLMKFIRRNNKEAAFVLNAVKPRVNLKKVKDKLDAAGPICPIEIGDRIDYPNAADDGLGIIEAKTRSPEGADEVRGVWGFVKRRIWTQAGDGAQPRMEAAHGA